MREKSGSKLPEYGNPPITEVVCGVQFESLDRLMAAHLGLLWTRFNKDFPKVQEKLPLAPQVELFEQPNPNPRITISDRPELPRTWFISGDECDLVQVQRDRFLHNWRKQSSEVEYPRFQSIFGNFKAQLAVFEQFLEKANLGSLKFDQYELTYINVIMNADGFANTSDAKTYFRDVGWDDSERVLPRPEQVNATYGFVFPDERIRLHVNIHSAFRSSTLKPVFRLDLTARGMPLDTSPEARDKWFENAHKRIVTAFADVTDPDIQRDDWKLAHE